MLRHELPLLADAAGRAHDRLTGNRRSAFSLMARTPGRTRAKAAALGAISVSVKALAFCLRGRRRFLRRRLEC
jgi:hypothetical protein